MEDPAAPSRTEAVLLAGVYVVPLTLSIGFLAWVGLRAWRWRCWPWRRPSRRWS